MAKINTAFAKKLGREFATHLNATPSEGQNKSELDRRDKLLKLDYITLRDHYGFSDMNEADVQKVKKAYQDGFKAAFIPEEFRHLPNA